MNGEAGIADIGYLDTLAAQDGPLHRLDPRIKILTTLVFIGTVVSFGRYAVTPLLPFFIFPAVQMAAGGISFSFIAKRVAVVAPFAVLVGVFNPLLDRHVLAMAGALPVTGGMLSFISILLRFMLTAGAALILIALTGFNTVCLGLEKMKVPRPFVVQLLFLYRYLFVLARQGQAMARAVRLRSDGHGIRVRVFASLTGQLLLRTLERARRVHLAMLCRGFAGHLPEGKPLRLRTVDLVYLGGWTAVFILLRLYNLPVLLGGAVTGVLS